MPGQLAEFVVAVSVPAACRHVTAAERLCRRDQPSCRRYHPYTGEPPCRGEGEQRGGGEGEEVAPQRLFGHRDGLPSRNTRANEGTAARRAGQGRADIHTADLGVTDDVDAVHMARRMLLRETSELGNFPPDGVRLVRIQSHDRAGAVDEGDIAAGRNRHLLHLSSYPDEI